MRQKQYADMTTIMQFGRIFADQIYKCMESTGLLEQGFEFKVEITNGQYLKIDTDFIEVCLEKSIDNVPEAEYYKTCMEQTKFEGKGWEVCADPFAEAGSVPPEVHLRKTGTQDDAKADRPAPAKEDLPCDLWFSAYDDPPAVGGGQ